jgi:16S rRNA (uracil1498-N3)-methyltransferase
VSDIRSFFYSGPVEINQTVQIRNSDFHHIRNVLRLSVQDNIYLLTDSGKYFGIIDCFGEMFVQIRIINKEEIKPILPNLHLIQGIPKGWKMDEIIEKSTEMGVSKIYPAYMNRSIPKFSAEEEKNKQMRWEKIAIAASKQSRRSNVPQVLPLQTFEKLIQSLDSFAGGKILCWEVEQKKSLVNYLTLNHVSDYLVVIGPEGGITYDEAKFCEDHGFISVSLGDTILRTETAAPFSIGLIAYLWNTIK